MAAAHRSTILLRVAKRLPRTFGPRLKQLRELTGETQEQFASHCGISVRSISRWECGGAMPDIAKAVLLAGKFGIELEDLLGIPSVDG